MYDAVAAPEGGGPGERFPRAQNCFKAELFFYWILLILN